MKPYYDHAGITIFHGDAREVLPTLDAGSIDLLLADPPYGMNWDSDSTRFTGGVKPEIRRGAGRNDWPAIANDDMPFDPSPWLVFPRVVLWGYNHFAQRLPLGTILVWIKKRPGLFGTFLSDAEIAWMKGGHGVYCFEKQFPPPSRMMEGSGRCLHPTQKPLSLMAWCIVKSKMPNGGLILDPFMGSGTTLRAAKDAGCRAIGVEICEAYCEIAVKRLAQGVFDWS